MTSRHIYACRNRDVIHLYKHAAGDVINKNIHNNNNYNNDNNNCTGRSIRDTIVSESEFIAPDGIKLENPELEETTIPTTKDTANRDVVKKVTRLRRRLTAALHLESAAAGGSNGAGSSVVGLSREERRRSRRATEKYRTAHASRERIRVEAFNVAFGDLRRLLPTLPPDKKLSKIEILRLAICYISYLNHVLQMS